MILLMGITIFSLICAVLAFIGGGLLAAVLALIAGWIGGLLLVLLFLVAVCLPVDRETPPENDSKFFRIIAKLYIDMAIRLGRIELRTEGLEKIPKEGRFMLVCNHLNELDPAVMLHCFPDSQLAFISKKENKYLPIISQVMHKLMCPLIDRENDREALKTILRCIDMLKQDKVSIGVFPEGYVSLDGRLRHFRGGVFKIAQKTGVPIVVCTIRNTKKAMRDLFAMRKTWIEMHLVDVVDAEEVKATATMDMAERVYEIMIRDLGETYRSEEKAMHPNLQTCIDPIE
jgi:1-acyl-sn-glycerol-3-phosphate acyltransferase